MDKEKIEQLQQKVVSEANMAQVSDDSAGEIQKNHNSFEFDPYKPKTEEGNHKALFKPSTKKKIQLTFENIVIKTIPKTRKCCRRIENPDAPKVILNDVSGTIKPGQFLAIIGASGAGKTTLLNFLSGREISKNLDKQGNIFVNGKNRNTIRGFSAISAYVQQDDILFQTMTVRECLEFAAKLKLPGTYQEKMNRVDEIVKELRLNKCQNTKIGGPLVKGVSGGERKRCSIGVELITDPNLIFLDEPTTGLDSFTATSVVETLRELALAGRTVISTIHQPNSDIFDSFDRLMLMAQGKIIYYNEAKLAVNFFAQQSFACPELSNPADYFMSIMSIESHEEEDTEDRQELLRSQNNIMTEYTQRINRFHYFYEHSDLKNNYQELSPEVQEISDQDIFTNQQAWMYQLGLLAKRNFLNIIRLPQTSYVKIIVTVITACFTIVLFQNCDGTLQGVQNRNGALFFMTMSVAFNAIQNIILIFPDERPVFLREVNNNMYSVSAYFFGKILAEFPASVITPVLYGCIVYFAIGLSTVHPYTFWLFLGILILLYCAAGSYALIISSIFSDKQLAVTLTPVLIIPFMLFAGFFVNQDNIPIWLIEFQYLSFFKYGYQALMLNEYKDNHLACMDEPPTSAKYCDPLGDFNSPQTLGESIIALAAMYVGCYTIALIIMKLLSTKYE